METTLINYGALGVMCLVLISLVYYLLKEHKDERREWRETTNSIIKDQTQATKDLTNIITVLKTMIEDRK